MPLHSGKSGAISAALGRSIDYIENPDKTDGGEWVSFYECDPANADAEFMLAKRQYAMITGRSQGDRDVIAYHLRQSFKPDEVDPATANKIGYDLAMSLTKGRHAFLVCTHVDKAHCHSHIIFNSTTLDCTKKFRNFLGSSFAVRKISDRLCLENGLSVIENPKPSRGSYATWLDDGKPPTARDRLRELIDSVFPVGKDYDAFIVAMEAAGVEIKRGKQLSFRLPGGKKFMRQDTLGEDYSYDAIFERISGRRVDTSPKKVNLLIDIQSKMQQGYNEGFRKWATLQNLKDMAKTLIYLQENGLDDYGLLVKTAGESVQRYNGLSGRTKANEARMKEIAELQKNIKGYSRTKDIYRQYRESGWSQKFYDAHESDIIIHRAAKKAFDDLGLKKLPSMQNLIQEYAILSAENKKLYPEQKLARQKMIELLSAKNNTDMILGVSKQKPREHEIGGR